MKIYKYKLQLEYGLQTFEAPSGKILDIQFQGLDLVAWIMFNDKLKDTCRHSIQIIPTGEEFEMELNPYFSGYFKTLQHPNCNLVFHIYV